MTSPLLTVGIPTYNGAHRIGHTLDSVLKQIPQEMEGQIDILVSDNASTDGTAALIQAYQAKHAVRIRYSRNESNLGYDRNVDMLFKMADGRYVWTLADDDALKDGALAYVTNVLRQHPNLKVVQVNFDSYDPMLENCVSQLSIPSDVLCHSADEFLSNSKGRYGQVSSLVISRNDWNKLDLTNGFGSNYIHIYALYRILLLGDSFIVAAAFVKARMGSENFGTSGDAILLTPLGGGRVIAEMRKMGYGRKISRQLLIENRKYVYGAIREAKKRGIHNKWLVIRNLIAVHNSVKLWIKWIPVILWPN